MSLRTADYDYQLPDELIARYPPERRDESRMMLVESESQRVTHLWFRDFVELLGPDELVVLNNTKVIPARIRFPDRNAEILMLEQVDPFTWRCLVRPGKSFAKGRTFPIHGHVGRVVQMGEDGDRLIRFDRLVNLDEIGSAAPVLSIQKLAAVSDAVVECAPAAVFADIAVPVLSAGKKLIALSAGQLLRHPELVALALPPSLVKT